MSNLDAVAVSSGLDHSRTRIGVSAAKGIAFLGNSLISMGAIDIMIQQYSLI